MGDQQGERLRRQKNKGLLSMATEVFLAMTENIVRSPQGAAEGGRGRKSGVGPLEVGILLAHPTSGAIWQNEKSSITPVGLSFCCTRKKKLLQEGQGEGCGGEPRPYTHL